MDGSVNCSQIGDLQNKGLYRNPQIALDKNYKAANVTTSTTEYISTTHIQVKSMVQNTTSSYQFINNLLCQLWTQNI